jgi:hypothetical protein
MKYLGIHVLIVVALVGLIGCAAAHKPTPEQIAVADYGSYPEDYRQIVEDYMKKILIDPYSAVYEDWHGPSKGYFYDMSGTYYGYRVCVEINSKNRMGGYVGSKPFFFMIKDGRVVKMEGGYSYGTVGAEMMRNLCNF